MPWQETLVFVLASFVWQGAIIAGLLILLTALFRIHTPAHRYAASLFAFVLMAVCPIVTWSVVQGLSHARDSTSDAVRADDWMKSPRHAINDGISTGGLAPFANRPTDFPQISHPNETDPSNADFNGLAPEEMGQFPVPSTAARVNQIKSTRLARTRSWAFDFYALKHLTSRIVSVWIAGVSLLSLRLAFGAAGTHFWRLNLESLTDDLTDQVRKLCQTMSMSMPRVQISHRVTEALVIGLWRPMILIPVAWVTELPPDMLEAVLAHELAHIRRFDLWINLGQRIIETLLFYHPAVWWLSCRLRVERELCCDAVAVQSTHNAVRYAETLEHIALRVRESGVPSLAIGMRASNGVLLRRIRELLGPPQPQSSQDAWFAGILTFTVALAVALRVFGNPLTADSPDNAKSEKLAVPTTHNSDEGSRAEESEIADESVTIEKSITDATIATQGVVEISNINEQRDKKPAAKTVDQLRELLNRAIEVTGNRILTANSHSPWQIFQSILAMRRNCQLRLGKEKVNAIEWISTTQPRFDGEPWMLLTPDGAKFHSYSKKYYFEGHPGQFLALLSESDLPQDHEFHVEGKVVKLRDVIHNTMNELDNTKELTWVLWGLQHYLDFDATWKIRSGEGWSIARLVQTELKGPIVGAPCGGNCRLFALTRARDKYLRAGWQLEGVWTQADQRIKQFVATARSLQNPDGSFSADYYKGPSSTADVNLFFTTTGDTMEFLSIALPDADLNEQWVRNAVWKLARELIVHQHTQVDCGPLFHSLNALILYRERLQAHVALENNRAADLLTALTKEQDLTALKQLLDTTGKPYPEPVEFLDYPGSATTGKGKLIVPIDTPHGRIVVVGCKVVPIDSLHADKTASEKLTDDASPDAAFVFDAKGHLIARLGGEIHATGFGARDTIELVNLGPEEDWFVRVVRLQANRLMKGRTDYYRIDNPVIPSLRYVHTSSSNVRVVGSRTKPRFGRLYFNSDKGGRAADDQSPSLDISEAIEHSELPQIPTELYTSQPLADVVIEGNKNLPAAEIMKHIKIRAGQSVTLKQMKDDVDALIRLRWFAHVEPRIKQTDKGDILRFVVLERPLVQRVEYKGHKQIKQKVFDALTQLKPGSPFDIGSNREYARRIEEYYREKGYVFATVELEKGNNRHDREVVFAIKEGPKVHVSKVEFEGNNRILRLGAVKYKDGAAIDRESARVVENYYRENGFPFATIEMEKENNSNDGEVFFAIKEGPRIHVPGAKGNRGNQFMDPRSGVTNDEVNVLRELTWDGNRNCFLGAPNQLADGQEVYKVDADWSQEFEALTPTKNQLVISGGSLDYDHWHSWDFIVRENCETVVRLSTIRQNGEVTKFEKRLDPGIYDFLLQVKPDEQSGGTVLSIRLNGGSTEKLELPYRFDHRTPNKAPIVQLVDYGSTAKILELSDAASKAVLKVEIESRRP